MKALLVFFIFASLAFCADDVEKKIWDYIYKAVGNKFGTAGIMGNLYAESQFNPKNIQNTYEKKYGDDATYTANVDSGKHTKFIKDAAGYGLAQWTHWSKKELLYKFAKEKGKSIGDLDMQLEFLVTDIKTRHKALWNILKNAKSVKEASNAVLLKYERPASKDKPETQQRRAGFGQKFYDLYANTDAALDSVKDATKKETEKETQKETEKENKQTESEIETNENQEKENTTDVVDDKEKKVNDITFKKLAGAKFHQGKKFSKKPRWIVVHYTAIPGLGAEGNTKAFAKTSRAVSTHFFCDSKEVYSVVDEDHIAWHVGNGQLPLIKNQKMSNEKMVKYGDRSDWRYKLAAENHIRWLKDGEDFKGNSYSYGVDLCCTKANTKSSSVKDEDWDFHPKAIENAAKTVAYLCKKYDIPVEHVIRHGDATGKPCPRPFVSLPGDKDPKKNDQRWEDFKAMVKQYL